MHVEEMNKLNKLKLYFSSVYALNSMSTWYLNFKNVQTITRLEFNIDFVTYIRLPKHFIYLVCDPCLWNKLVYHIWHRFICGFYYCKIMIPSCFRKKVQNWKIKGVCDNCFSKALQTISPTAKIQKIDPKQVTCADF